MKPRGIKPGQVPDWRPGAVFWKPLADGREVTVYPLLGGTGRLCIGPLADEHGYDIAYRYATLAEAEDAAKEWDGESSEEPPGYETCEFGRERHPATISNPTEAPIPSVGDYVMPSSRDAIQMSEDFRNGGGVQLIRLERSLDDGRKVNIEGEKKVRVDGAVLCQVESVEVSALPEPIWRMDDFSEFKAEFKTGSASPGDPNSQQFDAYRRLLYDEIISPAHDTSPEDE